MLIDGKLYLEFEYEHTINISRFYHSIYYSPLLRKQDIEVFINLEDLVMTIEIKDNI